MKDRIALVTPWPPEHSGIADFSRDLAVGLVDAGFEVDVFTRAVAPVRCDGIAVLDVAADWKGDELSDYAHRIYQMGNNVEFHGWMLRALANHPGVVEVHDIVLHHLLVGLTCARDNWADYLQAVRDWYGDETARRAEAPLHKAVKPIWETPEVVDAPFFEIFLEHAEGIVVHSEFAARRIAEALPRVALRKVMQTYRHVPAAPRLSLNRIGIFGGVQDNKKLDWILEAFGYLDAFMGGIEVTVVGTVVPQCEVLIEQAKALKYLSIRFVGRVEEDAFLDELGCTDLCISLRYPTMGETSAVVMRALQLGVPTIVSDTGWYAELPSEVMKAPLDNTPHFLSSTIHRLITQPQSFREWADACARMTSSPDLSHGQMCNDITDFLQSFRAERYASDLVAAKLVEIGFTGDQSEHRLLATIEPRARL